MQLSTLYLLCQSNWRKSMIVLGGSVDLAHAVLKGALCLFHKRMDISEHSVIAIPLSQSNILNNKPINFLYKGFLVISNEISSVKPSCLRKLYGTV